jgi:hypothetical protein
LISIALEHADPDAARPFAEACSFPTLIDAHGELARHFGFKVVPNGILVDEAGTVRWMKFGGFSIDNPDDVAVVTRFLAGEAPGPSLVDAEPYSLGPVERDLVATKVRLGRVLLEAGRQTEAVAVWREALRLDPGNFTIRKQIWSVEYPEKFYPAIDFAWQGPQLEAERAQEIAEGSCGPDGCPIPSLTARTGNG